MNQFHAGAELRTLIASTDWPDTEEFSDLLRKLKKTYKGATRGTHANVLSAISEEQSRRATLANVFDRLVQSQVLLDKDSYDQLLVLINTVHMPHAALFTSFYERTASPEHCLSPYVRDLEILEWDGVVYGCRDHSTRNSFIYFKMHSSQGSFDFAGQISRIFLHACILEHRQRRVEPFLVVDVYASLSSAHRERDPYLRFPLLNTRLFYHRFGGSTVIHASGISCHFAVREYIPEDIQEPCIIARALDRVRPVVISQIFLSC